jgi:hypothetical protein
LQGTAMPCPSDKSQLRELPQEADIILEDQR